MSTQPEMPITPGATNAPAPGLPSAPLETPGAPGATSAPALGLPSAPLETPGAPGATSAPALGLPSAPLETPGAPGAMSAPAPGAAPVVVLDGVFARDTAGPRGATRGALLGATAALGPGVHAFLGAPEDGTIALCDALAGVRRPLRGSVRVAGEEPWTSPAARGRTGALLAAPDIPEARSVRACVEQVLVALGHPPASAAEVLAELGLGLLAARPTAGLSFAETRAVELALALAVVKRAAPPAVLVLFEPCADLAVPGAARTVEDQIAALRAAGAVVVLATSSPADARRLADEIWVLHRGAVLRHEPAANQALAFGDAEIAVTVAPGDSPAVRALAAAVTEHPAVRAALWEDPPPGSGRAPVLRVRGPDRDACALAVIDAAARAGVALESITSAVPDLPAVRSAAVARVQRARSLAQAPRPPVVTPSRPASQITASTAEEHRNASHVGSLSGPESPTTSGTSEPETALPSLPEPAPDGSGSSPDLLEEGSPPSREEGSPPSVEGPLPSRGAS